MKNLSALVNNVIEDSRAKIASAVDAVRPKLASVETVIAASATKTAHMHDEDCDEEGKPKKKMKPEEKRASVISTAQEGLKFAENLDQIALLFPKLSGEMAARLPGQVENFVSPDKGQTKDTPTKAQSLSHEMASSGGDKSKTQNVATNRHDAPYAAKAAQAMLDSKLAQAEALKVVGRAKEAEKLASDAKAEFVAMKAAYEEEDPSTKTPKGNAAQMPTLVSGTQGAPGGVAPDNAGMASFTKRDGKKREIASLSQHIKEPAFSATSDKGLSDNLEHTQGAKIASFVANARARKTAAKR